MIAKELELEGQNVNKYYQLRLPSDTSKDYYYIIRETPNNQTLIINYGYVDSTGDDVIQLKNNWKDYAEAVVRAIVSYVNSTYVPIEGTNFYIVKSKDSLYSIASKYNTTVDAIKKLNNLSSNLLSIGQVLKIPSEEINSPGTSGYTTYTVKSKDSLYSIANRYNTTVDAIKTLNNLSSNLLSIGQVLKIRSEEINSPDTSGYTTYTVKSKDSLYSIASKYNTTVDAIKALNNLSSNLLSIGQVLKIPSQQNNISGYTTYTVKSKDNLYSIANQYNTTVDAIKALNNLSSNLLSIGQVLKIPSQQTNTSGYTTYTVKSKDNLYSIASRYNTTVDAIKTLNNLSSNLLSIGQILKIPSS